MVTEVSAQRLTASDSPLHKGFRHISSCYVQVLNALRHLIVRYLDVLAGLAVYYVCSTPYGI